ncbi:MAG: diguanylate cyclase [Betaproteobacteria bacterium]|nr:diguanylate cyclase [Betaproteobacteria bacterium]
MASKRGLSIKLVGYVAAGVMLTSTAIGIGRVHTEQSHLSELLRQSGQGIANTAAAGAASLVAGYDYGNLEILSNNVAQQAGVIHVAIRNASDRIVTQTEKQMDTPSRRFQAAIVFDNKNIGEVTVGLSTETEDKAIRALYLRILVEQIVFAGILGLILFVITSRGIVAPIHRVTETMEAATAKGAPYVAEALPVNSEDEIGRLIAVFNKLNRALADYYAQLQGKVQAADQALKDKNIELVARTEELEHTLELLGSMATTDWLTKLPNRRQFDETFDRLIGQAERFGEPLTLVLFDIDHFKQINDGHGHAAGDEVLHQIGNLAKDMVRKADLPARLGGDEFAVILYHTEEAQAEAFMRQLIDKIRSQPFHYNGSRIPVTISAGAAEYGGANTSPQALYFAADRALYSAKHQGRDRYALYSTLAKETT